MASLHAYLPYGVLALDSHIMKSVNYVKQWCDVDSGSPFQGEDHSRELHWWPC